MLKLLVEDLKQLPLNVFDFIKLNVTECYNFNDKGADVEIKNEDGWYIRTWLPKIVMRTDPSGSIWVAGWFAKNIFNK